MATFQTKEDINFGPSRIYSAFRLPKGTQVILIKGASGTEGDLWAVRDVKIIMDLTGNTHDPKYRYFWIAADKVEEKE